MGWVSAVAKQVSKSAIPDGALAKVAKSDLGTGIGWATVGAVLPAETQEERLRNMALLGGGAALAKRIPVNPEVQEVLQGVKAAGFGGVKARTAPLKDLEKAQALELSGASARDIWKQTGWMKGADDGWRFEIDDSKAEMKIAGSPLAWAFDLDEVMQHDALFRAYPELAKVQVVWKDLGPIVRDKDGTVRGNKGAFSDDDRTIYLNRNLTKEEARETILHEVQHDIQSAEGFALGGKPKPGIEFFETPEIIDAFTRLGNLKVLRDGATEPERISALNKAMDEVRADIKAQAEYEAYKRLPGEIEARSVEARAGMTPEQRRENFPVDSWDAMPVMRARDAPAAPPVADDVLELTEDMEVLDLDTFIAFHGTLARFDKFDASKLGAGEGAQVFGPGHYFTQSKGVAEWYRKRMKNLSPGVKLGKEDFNKANPAHFALASYWKYRNSHRYEDAFRTSGYGQSMELHSVALEMAIRSLKFDREELWRTWVASKYTNPTAKNPALRDHETISAYLDQAIAYLKTIDPNSSRGIPKPSKRALRGGGNIYTVALKLPREKTIQFDDPFGKQPEKVRAAFTEAAERGALGDDAKAALAKYGDTTRMDVLVKALKGADSDAMKIMQANGIRGVRYADGMSRGKRKPEEKTFNFVVFADEDVKILERKGMMFKQEGGPLDDPTRFETPGSPAYEAAKAKGLDMSQAGRMQRAKEMGFDTETVLYHGTDGRKIRGDSLDPTQEGRATGASTGAGVVWATENAVDAGRFAKLATSNKQGLLERAMGKEPDALTGQSVMPMMIRKQGLMVVERQPLDWDETDNIVKEAKRQGFSGVVFRRPLDDDGAGPVYAIFDPSNIRSVNAAFDPEQAASANLMMSQRGGPLTAPRFEPEPEPTIPPERAAEAELSRSLGFRALEAVLYAGGALMGGGAIAAATGWEGISLGGEDDDDDMTAEEEARWKAQRDAVQQAEFKASGKARQPAPITYNALPVTDDSEEAEELADYLIAVKYARRHGTEPPPPPKGAK